MQTPDTDQPPRQMIIRRVFYRSLSVIAVVACAALVLWILPWQDAAPPPLEDAEVTGPVSRKESPVLRPPVVRFTDITTAAGIDFVHVNGHYGEKLMPETIGSGAAFIDYDNDGDQDLLLVNSSEWPGRGQLPQAIPALYRNDGDGSFEDVTRASGLAINCYGMGVAVGDFDNDGWNDLYLTALGSNYLLHNDKGHFRDVTADAGVAGLEDDWSTAAAFIDYDNDGDLDLFVGNYVLWSRKINLEIDFRVTGLGRAYGAPNHFTGAANRLYRNEGNGRFSDVSHAAGIVITDPVSKLPEGKTLGVAPVDYDGDGWLDLFVANDTDRNFLYHNLGDGRFEEVGSLEGIAYDRNGKSTSAMGIDAAWFRNDAELGIGIGNFANEMSSLFVTADGATPFADEAILEGFGPASRLALTFGLFFFDYDLDGRQDLFQANGHLENDINVVQPSQTYAQSPQLFWNCGEVCRTRFIEVTNAGQLTRPLVGRGATYADIDADGDLDILVVQNGRRAELLRNDQQLGHHWLRVRLEGRRANRSAIGARVELTAGGVRQRRLVMPTRSYLSQVELPLTFGLGDAKRVDALRVTWPNGQVQHVAVDELDTQIHIVQPETE